MIKLGSGVLTRADGVAIDEPHVESICRSITSLLREGYRPIIVSSGAAAAGMMAFDLKQRPEDLATLQACCAVGQCRLMHVYESSFQQDEVKVAQLLLTYGNFATPQQRAHVRVTLDRLLEFGDVVPIVNENDSVAVEELRVGDNDTLSAHLAGMIQAELLVLLTSVEGLRDPQGQLVSRVTRIEEAKAFVRPETGKFSVGGMMSKLDAVQTAASSGVPSVIADGRNPQQLLQLVTGRGTGTRFELEVESNHESL